MISGALTFTIQHDPDSQEKIDLQKKLLPFYIVLMIFFFINNIGAIILMIKNPFEMKRSEADSASETMLEHA